MAGEVVFTTGMVGYPETLTDPSYRGQILVLTYPLVGNYGVPDEEEKDELGLPAHFESDTIHIAGLIVSSYSGDHSHWNSTRSLSAWLKKHGIPALYGVDTRAVTKCIREHGVVLGQLEVDGKSVPPRDPNTSNLVAEVTVRQTRIFGEGNRVRLIAFDCGMKYNIIRHFVCRHKLMVYVVPFDYDLKANKDDIQYDGIFISNGPGNPTMCSETIESLRWVMETKPNTPIFGICLGNQLLALAAGCKTYKMKFGNRGMNQPCVDLRTTKCYVTPQNHGYAVDSSSLPEGWKPFFLNANDSSNEGITHVTKHWCSVQFHPEAAGGPTDTEFLFDMFVQVLNGGTRSLTLISPKAYEIVRPKKVLLLGSGGLSIGQAGEFDYSGSQAIKAFKEEGLTVILINPNIATVQTSKNLCGAGADRTYFLPVKIDTVTGIIEKELPDSICVSMGGQTALNVGVELYQSGLLKKYDVQVLGTPISTIIETEDRMLFAQKLAEINETLAKSICASNMEEAVQAAKTIGYPVLIRAAYALGGLGSGFADNEEQFRIQAGKAFANSHQIIIDQDLRGWKEVEYEVVRDTFDNCITVCNMENFDPLGVHTGDSIVIAPSQTLSNREYFNLRSVGIKVIRHLGIVGECNIQYALNPDSEEYCIIEVNARLSRSSALASKATGYPLAYVAAKLSLGKDLVSIRNSVTKVTTACFEPSLDYCVLKMPRWDLKKFNRVSTRLGSSMTSVGEVMSIGRTFEEVLQKACRMVNPANPSLEGRWGNEKEMSKEDQLRIPTDQRLFSLQAAFEDGWTVDCVHQLSKIDLWFLQKLNNIARLKDAAKTLKLDAMGSLKMRVLKCAGFSDFQIAEYTGAKENEVRQRRKDLNIIPSVKQIDTLAAEFPAGTNYLYMTYSGNEDDVSPEDNGIMVLGCGAYCIGSSVEFDWCAVSCVWQLHELGHKAIVVNYNPETVSTDYDVSDRLYFEELSHERVMDIYEWESSVGVVVSVGGQIPQNLASPLHQSGARILGTSPENIDRAEDRDKFSAMLDSLFIDQPEWSALATVGEAIRFAERVHFPVLVRPSFVLSGAAMAVASTVNELKKFLTNAGELAKDRPVVISKYILNAKEIEFDGVAQNGKILNYAISEHVENAGVHSGDATLVLPAQKLWVETIRRVKRVATAICASLKISGPFNVQLMAVNNEIKVIECNLRASRTFPFISKTFGANFITLATKAMIGLPVKPYNISLLDTDYVAVKAPMFSFTRLRGADPTLGVEMSSTGEVACFGWDSYEAFLHALRATNVELPTLDKPILVSIFDPKICLEFLPYLNTMIDMGYTFCGTPGTAKFYSSHGYNVISLHKNSDEHDGHGAVEHIMMGRVCMVINIPEGACSREDVITLGYTMRRAAVDYGVPLITNIKCAILLTESLLRNKTQLIKEPYAIEDFYSTADAVRPIDIGRKGSTPVLGARKATLIPPPFHLL